MYMCLGDWLLECRRRRRTVGKGLAPPLFHACNVSPIEFNSIKFNEN